MQERLTIMNRFICIHGHFYQPPRENPWLDEVELQDSAYPYHDWNERITAECYAPNAASRMLDSEGNIADIVNNYSQISFNFGPTLLSWMEKHRPDTYQLILDADRQSLQRFSGHGSALAQVYSHMIMPLANSRDRRTQILWGIKDFEYRFQRTPEGMWLAETAVDLETLDCMSECGIAFTILAPHQARSVRAIGSDEPWADVSGQQIDPKMPYMCRMPSGRSIAVFFYDGPISVDVSFRNLLRNGENFAGRLLGAFAETESPQLVHIATDGETYGHHHRYGDMALTYCLHHLSSNNLARITVYGEYLALHPPTHEVQIHDNSSWSCAHGVERWRDDCGCNIGSGHKWNQQWRKPLRQAVDWLRDSLAPLYERGASAFFDDPWDTRNNYIDLMLARSRDNAVRFLQLHSSRTLSPQEATQALKYLEMQRNAMLMYTSCGWFFDDISGIETIQILSYAACAMQAAGELSGVNLEPEFLSILQKARSNRRDMQDGMTVYKKYVQPAVADLVRVGAHYAVSSLFEDYPETLHFFCYTAESQSHEFKEAGNQRLAVGKARLVSNITLDDSQISFAILHLGDHNIVGGIHPALEPGLFETMKEEIDHAFLRSDIPEVIKLIEKHFGSNNYSLWHLFRDEQRKVIHQVITTTLQEQESSFRRAYKRYYPIMQVMDDLSMPLPAPFKITTAFTLNQDLKHILEEDETDPDRLTAVIEEIKRWSVDIDRPTITYVAMQTINKLMERFLKQPDDLELLRSIHSLLLLLDDLDLEPNIWEAQNIYFDIGKKTAHRMQRKSSDGGASNSEWMELFVRLGRQLHVRNIG